jgi:DnaJ-class molecular chaperone
MSEPLDNRIGLIFGKPMKGKTITCVDCEGSGIEPGSYVQPTWESPSEAEPCGRCNGRGWEVIDDE